MQSVMRESAGFVAQFVALVVLATTPGMTFGQVSAGPAQATASPAAEYNDQDFSDKVRRFLARHCLECHGIDEPKGDPGNTLSRPELEDKALRLAAFSGAASAEEMRKSFERLWALDGNEPVGRWLA